MATMTKRIIRSGNRYEQKLISVNYLGSNSSKVPKKCYIEILEMEEPLRAYGCCKTFGGFAAAIYRRENMDCVLCVGKMLIFSMLYLMGGSLTRLLPATESYQTNYSTNTSAYGIHQQIIYLKLSAAGQQLGYLNPKTKAETYKGTDR